MLIAPLLALTACAGSIAGDLEPPPTALVAPCDEPTQLPVRTLTQAEVEVAWGRDRAALRACGERHGLLVRWVEGQVGSR